MTNKNLQKKTVDYSIIKLTPFSQDSIETDLLLSCIRDFYLEFPNGKVARDGLMADHADYLHAGSAVYKFT